MKLSAAWFALGIGALVALSPARADACSWAPGPQGWIRYPWFSANDFPANGLFTSSLEWRSRDGAPLVLVVDEALTATWGLEVRRPASPLSPGALYEPTEDCPSSPCRHVLSIGAADTTPPSTPDLTVRTLLVRDPQGAGAFSCPDTDALELVIHATDDTTPAEHLSIAAYVAPDVVALAARTEPDLIFAFDPGPADEPPTTATITLGESVGRQRDGAPLRVAGPFCFAVAIVDWAGNVGPRSTPTCLDTTDPSDPTVVWVASAGCACQGGRGGASFGGVVLVVGALLRRRRPAPTRR